MKLSVALFILAIQVPAAQGILCWIFGLFASGSARSIETFLDTFADEPQSTGFPIPYDRFVIDDYETPRFDGCSFSYTTSFRYYNSALGPDSSTASPGTATSEGTFDLFTFLFGFRVCIDDLMVTELDFENSPGTVYEDFARDSMNAQIDNPECFDD